MLRDHLINLIQRAEPKPKNPSLQGPALKKSALQKTPVSVLMLNKDPALRAQSPKAPLQQLEDLQRTSQDLGPAS